MIDFKQKLVSKARELNYHIVYLMLKSQSAELLYQNYSPSIARFQEVGKDRFEKELTTHLQEQFQFNQALSSKFAKVYTEVLKQCLN